MPRNMCRRMSGYMGGKGWQKGAFNAVKMMVSITHKTLF